VDWVTIIIVGISIAVWVFANLASLNKKQQPKAAQAVQENDMARSRPSASEIDKFLEEVNRRKQLQQERRTAPPVVQKKEVKKPPPPKPASIIQREIVVAEPVVQAVIVAQPIETPSVTVPVISSIPSPPIPMTAQARPGEPAHVRQAKSLLKSKDGMKAVFLVNEILGIPRSRRPWRRHV
jgi:hypothetical protein